MGMRETAADEFFTGVSAGPTTGLCELHEARLGGSVSPNAIFKMALQSAGGATFRARHKCRAVVSAGRA